MNAWKSATSRAALGSNSDGAGSMKEIEQLDGLRAANRRAPDAAIERELLKLRAQAFLRNWQAAPQERLLNGEPDGAEYGLPIVAASELDVSVLRRALAEYGALHVRGLLDSSRVEFMRNAIDCALAAESKTCADGPSEETRPWFEPFDTVYGGDITRNFARVCGSMLSVDSPRGMFYLTEMFSDVGLDQLLSEFFGERPALSVEKTMLRRVATWKESGDWHQDGTFLGPNIRSVNVWLTLSDCGVDAPSLEIVPKRLHRLLAPTSSYVTSHAVVEQEFPGARIRPEFKAGDALLFDHFLLHRTWHTVEMTKLRYALESWFFAPSTFPGHYTGLYI
jgi:hypothetical protein